MTQHAKGEFDVKIVPISSADEAIGRLSIDKVYHGDLEASGIGQMMAIRDEAAGSGVYVAIETVNGTLKGKHGSFQLAHRGMMTKAGQELSIVVVTGSGTGALSELSGDLDIIIKDGKHFYTLDYVLPTAP